MRNELDEPMMQTLPNDIYAKKAKKYQHILYYMCKGLIYEIRKLYHKIDACRK